MQTENFHASVQYGDMRGSVAADKADRGTATQWLQDRGLLQEGEFLIGIQMYASHTHGVPRDAVNVDFLLCPTGGFDSVRAMLDATDGPIVVRKVSAGMSVQEFFGLFKRFNVTLSPDSMLEGRDFMFPDY